MYVLVSVAGCVLHGTDRPTKHVNNKHMVGVVSGHGLKYIHCVRVSAIQSPLQCKVINKILMTAHLYTQATCACNLLLPEIYSRMGVLMMSQ